MDREPTMQELQEHENVRVEQATKEAASYTEANIFPATSRKRCGDDRDEQEGFLAVFGADTGFAAALLAEGVSARMSRQIVIDHNRSEGNDTFDYHDAQGKPVNHKCGHEEQLTLHPDEYGVSPDDIQIIASENQQDLEAGKASKITYQGEHNPVRVIRVHGRKYTVRSYDGTQKNFVLDIDRIEDEARKIAQRAIEEGAKVDEQKYVDRVFAHMNLTASYLGANLDIFDVFINDNGKLEKLVYGGKVPAPQKPEKE